MGYGHNRPSRQVVGAGTKVPALKVDKKAAKVIAPPAAAANFRKWRLSIAARCG